MALQRLSKRSTDISSPSPAEVSPFVGFDGDIKGFDRDTAREYLEFAPYLLRAKELADPVAFAVRIDGNVAYLREKFVL